MQRRSSAGARSSSARVAPRGQVKLDGEVWDARATQEIELGAEVVVTGLDGLVLDVEPSSNQTHTP